MERYVCVHGHFYQPPRENPWLERVEIEDSAAPYHDWNERISAECYGPNAASRILDGEGFVEQVGNNYARMSFNFGPTLISWLERAAPETYEAVLAADRESSERFSGHGSAMAQVYNHLIMPLASRRDKQTQVVWGKRDFEHRFGRKPEGMWLPETAVDTETLEVLAEQGILFTILSPHQARRVRGEDGDWYDIEGTIDTTKPYLTNLPSGKQISVFFYDAALSQAVAFERLLISGDELARRIIESIDSGEEEEGEGVKLANLSTDGETYGHHHRFGDMALAYALEYIEREGLARLTNYGEFLAQHPAETEVEVHEPSAWSCAHGVERWRSDCGCNFGTPGWNQAWRAPLRESLDWLRDRLSEQFEAQGATLLRNPWAARDDYIELVLDRSDENVKGFMERHATGPLSSGDESRVLKLLELQRQSMLMFASCAWFFDDVSGIETVQGMKHAARAIQLAEAIGGEALEEQFKERLAAARSNLPDPPDGAAIYERYVKPSQVDLARVAAHFAVLSLFEEPEESRRIGSYTMEREDFRLEESGRNRLALGRLRVRSEVTRESGSYYFAIVHLGDQNLSGGLAPIEEAEAYERLAEEAEALFRQGDPAAVLSLIAERCPGEPLSLRALFRDEQRRVLDAILEPLMAGEEAFNRHLYQEHISLIRFLNSMHYPTPRRLRIATEVALDAQLERALSERNIDEARVRALVEEAKLSGLELSGQSLSLQFAQTLERLAEEFAAAPQDEEKLKRFQTAVHVLSLVPFHVDLWRVQNVFFQAVQRLLAAVEGQEQASDDLAERLGALGEALKVRVRAPRLRTRISGPGSR
jgi:alpha-amylase/alpha-mannosidase (GH57 family)